MKRTKQIPIMENWIRDNNFKFSGQKLRVTF